MFARSTSERSFIGERLPWSGLVDKVVIFDYSFLRRYQPTFRQGGNHAPRNRHVADRTDSCSRFLPRHLQRSKPLETALDFVRVIDRHYLVLFRVVWNKAHKLPKHPSRYSHLRRHDSVCHCIPLYCRNRVARTIPVDSDSKRNFKNQLIRLKAPTALFFFSTFSTPTPLT